MNPSTLERIQTFTHRVLLPTFAEIEQFLEDPEYKVILTSNAETGNNAVDVMLQQMHLSKPYVAQLETSPVLIKEPHAAATTWVGHSLYIEVLEAPETEPICIGQYCLSIEFGIISTEAEIEQIQVMSTVGCIKPGGETLQTQQCPFEKDFSPLDIENISSLHINLQFAESFEEFQTSDSYLSSNDLGLPQRTSTLNAQPAPVDIPLESAPDPEPPEPTSDPEPAAQPDTPTPTPQQQLYALRQKAIELSSDLAPSPHTPLVCKLNAELPTTAQIIALRDPYNRIVNLSLEYSPAITEPELLKQLQRLGHYQHLDHLANQRRFIEDQMKDWLKLHGQPSLGAIAHQLQTRIAQQSKTLYDHLYTLAESCLDTLTAQALQTDREQFATAQQREQDLLEALEQNPIAGYLDVHLLEQHEPLQSLNPFTEAHPALTFHAKFLKRKGKEPNNSLMLNHIAACQSETYQSYRQRFPSLSALHLAIRYTLNQKLYPNRPLSVGPATKDTYPRLELLAGGTDESAPSNNPFTQIWRSFPLLRSHPPQWLVITATSETQKLKTIALENGQIAEEGTKEYLWRSLQLMTHSPNAYTCELGTVISKALEQGLMKWVHLHQTADLETGEPRDIMQLQFQLSELR